MKNSAVKAMVRDQFQWANNLYVEFLLSEGTKEEYKVTFDDDGVYREFTLSVDFKELEE